MGTDSLFWRMFDAQFHLYSPSAAVNQVYAVDASVLMYKASRSGLGYETLTADPSDDDRIEALAERWADALINQLQCLSEAGVAKDQVVWFFEGRVAKARHVKQWSGRERKLNRCLRQLLEPSAPHYRHNARRKILKTINNLFGRPEWWLTARIAAKIAARGYPINADEATESDHRITSWSKWKASEGFEITVLSVDSDYLAFAPPNSISHLAMPNRTNPNMLRRISKKDVLEESELSTLQLVLAFAIAGSDNIATHIEGMGWFRSVRYVKHHIKQDWDAMHFFHRKGRGKLPSLIRWKHATEDSVVKLGDNITLKLGEFGWLNPAASVEPPPLPIPPLPDQSALQAFALSKDATGQILRPKIAELFRLHWKSLSDVNEIVAGIERDETRAANFVRGKIMIICTSM